MLSTCFYCIITITTLEVYLVLKEQDLINEIADIIRQLRRRKKYTFDKLSEMSNIDYSTLNLIENRKQNPRIYTLYKLLYALDIDILHLLKDRNNELKDSKTSIINKLEKIDFETLESVSELLDSFNISKKK